MPLRKDALGLFPNQTEPVGQSETQRVQRRVKTG